jgi:crossover junction endodeoxyribonuclease RuvC
MMRWFMYTHNFTYISVPPCNLKKFVTGKGNCAKELIIKEVYKRWGFDTDNNNIADAYGLAMMGAAMEGLIHMPLVNLSALDKLQTTPKKTKKTI